MCDLLHFRESLVRRKLLIGGDKITQQMFEDEIRENERIDLTADDKGVVAFLQGRPSLPDEWWRAARPILEYVLTGECKVDGVTRGRAETTRDKLIDFFILPDKDGARPEAVDWRAFLDDRFKYFDGESTSREAIAAIERLIYRKREFEPDAVPVIVRTSAGHRFQQSHHKTGELLASGTATIDALKNGVEVVYIFPVPSQQLAAGRGPGWLGADESALQFRRRAAQCAGSDGWLHRLHCLAVDLDESNALSGRGSAAWNEERIIQVCSIRDGSALARTAFLSPLARYAAHGVYSRRSQRFTAELLLTRRLAPPGLSATRARPHELKAFDDWFNAFIVPHARIGVERATIAGGAELNHAGE